MNIKSLLTGVLIGAVALPTISLGGTFVSSLIAGKTPEEAVQILGEQLDSLIGRVETIETQQASQEETIQLLQQQSTIEQNVKQQNIQELIDDFQKKLDNNLFAKSQCKKGIFPYAPPDIDYAKPDDPYNCNRYNEIIEHQSSEISKLKSQLSQ